MLLRPPAHLKRTLSGPGPLSCHHSTGIFQSWSILVHFGPFLAYVGTIWSTFVRFVRYLLLLLYKWLAFLIKTRKMKKVNKHLITKQRDPWCMIIKKVECGQVPPYHPPTPLTTLPIYKYTLLHNCYRRWKIPKKSSYKQKTCF